MYGLITDHYRMVPQEFDKIFHKTMQKSLSLNSSIVGINIEPNAKTPEPKIEENK